MNAGKMPQITPALMKIIRARINRPTYRVRDPASRFNGRIVKVITLPGRRQKQARRAANVFVEVVGTAETGVCSFNKLIRRTVPK